MKRWIDLSNGSFVACPESTAIDSNMTCFDPPRFELKEDTLSLEMKEEILNKVIRPERDRRLILSDAKWIEKSSKSEDLTALNAYKQALRDLPDNIDLDVIDYLDQIVWPVEGE